MVPARNVFLVSDVSCRGGHFDTTCDAIHLIFAETNGKRLSRKFQSPDPKSSVCLDYFQTGDVIKSQKAHSWLKPRQFFNDVWRLVAAGVSGAHAPKVLREIKKTTVVVKYEETRPPDISG
jgi:hypothetical protein